MRIRLRTLMAGPDGVVPPGGVIDIPADQARALIAGGFAEPAELLHSSASSAPETAALEAPEAAVTRRERPRGPGKPK